MLFERSNRAKRLNISVRPPGRIRVALPRGVSLSWAEKVVLAKSDWIRSQLNRLDQAAGLQKKLTTEPVADSRIVCRALAARLEELAELHGFSYNRVFFRSQRTRWGSCSAADNINLNIKLARLPAALLDYVLLHELLHTRLKNHQPVFWLALQAIMPDALERRRQLRQYSLALL